MNSGPTQPTSFSTRREQRSRGGHFASVQRQDSPSEVAWNVEDASELYGIHRWGNGYFGIAESGNLTVTAPGDSRPVELKDIVEGLQQRGLEMPVMLRIENLLADRIQQLNQSFADAIKAIDYRGEFLGVYPIKVNQQNHVVAEIARFGKSFAHGLEAGSKAELLIAMSFYNSAQSLIICNGYKDEEFIDLALQATKIGIRCFMVVETPEELRTIIDRSRHCQIKPLLGVRLKLSTIVEGHWAQDSGDRSLFGLSTRQLIEVIDILREADLLDCLELAHFHLGSQIPNIRNIRDGVKEACRFYAELSKEGAPLNYLDLGGGLAVDYDGSGSTGNHSRNYDLPEYCIDIVETVQQSLDKQGVDHPTLITESGRWTVAPMSVLLFDILSVTDFAPTEIDEPPVEDLHESTESLLETLGTLKQRRLQENLNDAIYYRDQMRIAFRVGRITLRERAFAENVCLTILDQIRELVANSTNVTPELMKISEVLSDIYYGNFSVFQSLPDAWAIEQVFPVVPIQRLHEAPTRNAIIADLTCDCDGKLSRFAKPNGSVSRTLRLHEVHPNEPYVIGVFLVGSYQETLGDLHNLFGDTNVATVRITQDSKIEFVHELEGDTIADVLSYVEYQPQEMLNQFRLRAEAAVQQGKITAIERRQMVKLFTETLRGYTYFED